MQLRGAVYSYAAAQNPRTIASRASVAAGKPLASTCFGGPCISNAAAKPSRPIASPFY